LQQRSAISRKRLLTGSLNQKRGKLPQCTEELSFPNNFLAGGLYSPLIL